MYLVSLSKLLTARRIAVGGQMIYDENMIRRIMEKYSCDYDTASELFNEID